MIPEHALVIVDSLHDNDRIVSIRWDEETLFVLSQDLRERAEAVAADRSARKSQTA
jgi:hypothetical protein